MMYEVQYSCKGCTDGGWVSVAVPERGEAQEIVDWFENVVRRAVSAAHAANSPHCTCTTADIKLEVAPGATRIGRNVRH